MPIRAGKKFYRAVYIEYEADPLPSRSASGRFHDERTGQQTTYLADTVETAWKEVTHRWKADPHVYRMVEVAVKAKMVLDFTREQTRRKYGVSKEMLIGEDYWATQRLANRLRAQKVQAFWTYSRAHQPGGRMLVVFLDNFATGCWIRVQAIRQVKK